MYASRTKVANLLIPGGIIKFGTSSGHNYVKLRKAFRGQPCEQHVLSLEVITVGRAGLRDV